MAVTLHSEQILTDLASYHPERLIKLLLPYASTPPSALVQSPENMQLHGTVHACSSPNVRLLALHVLASTMRHLSSALLIREMPLIVTAALPSLSSSLVDLRKAVIFVLVEAFMIIGDALYPFVQDLTPPQRKLFTIYIDRKMSQKVP